MTILLKNGEPPFKNLLIQKFCAKISVIYLWGEFDKLDTTNIADQKKTLKMFDSSEKKYKVTQKVKSFKSKKFHSCL